MGRDIGPLSGGGRPSLLTAHSGCLGTVANSQAYLEAALASCVDFIEVDLRLSPQQGLVLSHDPVAHQTDTELTLAVAWDRILGAGLGVNLDVKEVEVLGPLAAFVNARRESLAGRVIVTGCDADWVRVWRRACPQVPVLLNVLSGAGALESRETWEERIVASALSCGARGLNVDHRCLTEGLSTAAHLEGLTLEVWTVNSFEAMRRCAGMGVDGLTTDRPDLAHPFLTRF